MPKQNKQLSIWCTACKGEGVASYFDYKGDLRTVKCPICKGSKTKNYEQTKQPNIKNT